MKTKTIKQTINFKSAKPAEVYEMIMDAKKHGAITQSKAIMSKKPKGKFDIFGGYCTGHNIELHNGEKIIQAWRFEEAGWPEDHFSTCTFHFEKTKDGTKLVFQQEGVPPDNVENLKKGWHEYYWSPMKKFIEEGKHKL